MKWVGVIAGALAICAVHGTPSSAAQEADDTPRSQHATDRRFRAASPPVRTEAPRRPAAARAWRFAEAERWLRAAPNAAAQPGDSERLARAKDLIADDQWVDAIAVLEQAAADPRERSQDEVLFWLAHSQNQAGHLYEAVETIRRLQRQHASSRWVRPAHSLLIELAQKLGRRDVLWWTAVAPSVPPKPPTPPTPPPPGGAAPAPMTAPPPPARPPTASVLTPPVPPPTTWIPETYRPDPDLRVQALSRLIQSDPSRVIPILGNLALEAEDPAAARRAVYVLAQSRHPDAQTIVVDVARHGPAPVRIAAVRELGRFGGPEIARALLEVYASADLPVKQQVVLAFGERMDTESLLSIAHSEGNRQLREAAIVTLGRAGARDPLRVLYSHADPQLRRAIIIGLFNARDEAGLIRIASEEKNPTLKAAALARLKLLGTPRAKEYLEKTSK